MKATITSIHLRSPFKFFPLSFYAMHILKQLNTVDCVEFKKTGIWTTHYTMTLWKNESDLKAFASSGAHLDAMKKSASIAAAITTYTYDTESLPDWKTAKKLLETHGRVTSF